MASLSESRRCHGPVRRSELTERSGIEQPFGILQHRFYRCRRTKGYQRIQEYWRPWGYRRTQYGRTQEYRQDELYNHRA